MINHFSENASEAEMMESKVLLFHAFGNNNVKQATLALAEEEMLGEFLTGFTWDDNNWLNHWLPRPVHRELVRRSYPEIVLSQTRNFPMLELTRWILSRTKIGGLNWAKKMIPACRNRVDRKAAKALKGYQFNAVYGYDEASIETFKVANKSKIKCVYELSAAHPSYVNNIYKREIEQHPVWQVKSTDYLKNDTSSRVNEELALADAVVVASSYTHMTLDGYVDKGVPVFVNPYGAPLPSIESERRIKALSKKLRVLYVGSISMMKGIHYLLEAIKVMKGQVELTLVGMPTFVPTIVVNELQNYRWLRTLPNSEVLKLMDEHDVFVFPTLSDGFGLVILEALSRGLPVIATSNSGGADILVNGDNGFVVPICSSVAISEKLELLNKDRELLKEMSKKAFISAKKWTWSAYRKRLVGIVNSTLDIC